MGRGWFPTSTYQCSTWPGWNETAVTCSSLDFGTFQPNSDIAGRGVVLSFCIALIATIIITVIALILQALEFCAKKGDQGIEDSWRRVLNAALVGLSDTQAITGLALLITTEWYQVCGISVYHYNLVCDTVLMSLIVHFSSMTVIDHYFNVWYLSILRVGIIGTNFVLGFALFIHRHYANFPTNAPSQLPADQFSIDVASFQGTSVNGTSINGALLVLPAVCFMDNSTMTDTRDDARGALAFAEFVLLFIFFTYAVLMSVLHTHCAKGRKSFKGSAWPYWVRIVMALITLIGAILLIRHVFYLQNWMRQSGWLGEAKDEYEVSSFGQLLP